MNEIQIGAKECGKMLQSLADAREAALSAKPSMELAGIKIRLSCRRPLSLPRGPS
jgi:hypothetical protein